MKIFFAIAGALMLAVGLEFNLNLLIAWSSLGFLASLDFIINPN